jgi:hypothetical protein
MAEKMKGMGGLGKMGGEFTKAEKPNLRDEDKGKRDPEKAEKGKVDGDGGETQTTITHHADGTHTSEHQDGTREEHPDHLHMLAHIGHKVTGGDKHHIVHHDGMSAHSHSIGEDGQHDDHAESNSAEDAKGALDKFLGEEAEEPEHQHGGGEEEESEAEPQYGGMQG